jgi:hypothetical protein
MFFFNNYNILARPTTGGAGAGFKPPLPGFTTYQLNTSSSSSSFIEKVWLWGAIGSV